MLPQNKKRPLHTLNCHAKHSSRRAPPLPNSRRLDFAHQRHHCRSACLRLTCSILLLQAAASAPLACPSGICRRAGSGQNAVGRGPTAGRRHGLVVVERTMLTLRPPQPSGAAVLHWPTSIARRHCFCPQTRPSYRLRGHFDPAWQPPQLQHATIRFPPPHTRIRRIAYKLNFVCFSLSCCGQMSRL